MRGIEININKNNMFTSEHLLKNSRIATLEMCKALRVWYIDNGQPRWWIKNLILTDRALYLFPEKGDIMNSDHRKQFQCELIL